MTCLTRCFNSLVVVLLLLAGTGGSVAAGGGSLLASEQAAGLSWLRRAEAQLRVAPPAARIEAPQMLGTVSVPWSVEVAGGAGALTYEFVMRFPDGDTGTVWVGDAPRWEWTPQTAGPHQLRVTVVDALGRRAQSDWSRPFGITPPLRIEQNPVPDREAPQTAQARPIIWSASAIGGVGEKSYLFEVAAGGRIFGRSEGGPVPRCSWLPSREGIYRVRVRVSDSRGNEVTSDWSEEYRIAPPLIVSRPRPGIAPPQIVATVSIPWQVDSSGGVGARNHVFEVVREGGEATRYETGPQGDWLWSPQTAGVYRIRANVADALGNFSTGPWSEPYEIVSPLTIRSLTTDRPSPQAAQTHPLLWTADAFGGIGEKVYVFELAGNDGIAQVVQRDTTDLWSWLPQENGLYRGRVQVSDAMGNRVWSEWSEPVEIAPPLRIETPATGKEGAQFLVDLPLSWSVQASGGVGTKTIGFQLQREDEEAMTVQEGTEATWTWTPREPGVYRLRAVAADALGNRRESAWSAPVEIVAPLTYTGLSVDRPAPQRALAGSIRWTAAVTGGVGDITYVFQTEKGGVTVNEQTGAEPTWDWRPRKAGKYRLRVIASDADGRTVTSPWTPEYRIEPALGREASIALLPLDNISGVSVPLLDIQKVIADQLTEAGFRLVPADVLAAFMKKYRIRHTGGIGSRVGEKMREELGVEAVFITSVESYHEGPPPKLSLIARLVLCGSRPEIAWIESVGLAGDQAPGLLGLGLVLDPNHLLKNALDHLFSSLSRYLEGAERKIRPLPRPAGERIRADIDLKEKYLPRNFYRATTFAPASPYTVAVVPFLNEYARKNSGYVTPLHFVEQLNRYETLNVLEPGVVREQMLKYRLILADGPSLAVSDVLASSIAVDADLVASGKVFDYQGLRGDAKVDFSLQLVNAKKREVVWWSRSYASGDEGVYFYDVGRVHTAHGLMSRMAGAASAMIFNGEYP